MKKRIIVFINITLFLLASLVILNCNSNQKKFKPGGYINETETIFESKTNKILSIDRIFYRKLPTVHNGLIEIKQPKGEDYVIVVVKETGAEDFALFIIEDFNLFLKNARFIIESREKDVFIDVDDLKSTSMRKSLSFERGIFIRKEVNISASAIFDLSEKDLNAMEEAYNMYLKE